MHQPRRLHDREPSVADLAWPNSEQLSLLPLFPLPSSTPNGKSLESRPFGIHAGLINGAPSALCASGLHKPQTTIPIGAGTMAPVLRSQAQPSSEDVKRSKCREDILGIFPDICPKYLEAAAAENEWDSQRLIDHLLDEQEKGRSYPKRPKSLKRKSDQKEDDRKDDEEEELRRKFLKAEPIRGGREYFRSYVTAAKSLLKASFPLLYSRNVDETLKNNQFRLYPTYLDLHKACQNGNTGLPLKARRVSAKLTHPETALANSSAEGEKDALAEFRAARAACQEKDDWEAAKAAGSLIECGCCCDEFPMSKMVHCDGQVAHWFCRGCARRMAENVIGLSRYHLGCMAMEGCDATFSKKQKDSFLTDDLVTALEKIEQEAVLRLAGIENLETCPFCSYAAEYPPVEENKEFRCENPECGVVSCRHCRQETHIPKTCAEAAREQGLSARRKIEEAMSAALIRTCNKCGTPFIKEMGCNKMTCPRAGCFNMQCYVCSKTCDYSHFYGPHSNDAGKCPLYESIEKRHQEEVQAAEEKARKEVAEENPTVDVELLKFSFSERVKEDEERRKAAERPPAHAAERPLLNPVPYPYPYPVHPFIPHPQQ
ncbi:hypothetical protein VTK56DRAFT_1127 [Thermocarpiscus australiensis]